MLGEAPAGFEYRLILLPPQSMQCLRDKDLSASFVHSLYLQALLQLSRTAELNLLCWDLWLPPAWTAEQAGPGSEVGMNTLCPQAWHCSWTHWDCRTGHPPTASSMHGCVSPCAKIIQPAPCLLNNKHP